RGAGGRGGPPPPPPSPPAPPPHADVVSVSFLQAVLRPRGVASGAARAGSGTRDVTSTRSRRTCCPASLGVRLRRQRASGSGFGPRRPASKRKATD
ncbi:MAG: anaerobic sulfatase-maturating enzyme, partial [Burkholderiales bacterium]